ncbi:ABC transporter permease subunit [Epidermidibacterium keratini]|uniref:ABC transporter permease subunit n=1 Tax=Epidermidibacterium keratini TaxID=1891644 RepID=A0A7L4YRR6_9ACTN|nr:amino acid ABC transporter permease [Epidermidibacterium keratini]QHC01489.1 ABC transporter permease subunit [Epidermidibacterium keratini]
MTTSVLFDAPGPKARRRQALAGVLGGIVIAAIIGFLLWRMVETNQFAAAKWEIFANPNTITVLLNAFINTLIAAVLAIILSLLFGAIFGAMRVSTIAPLRWFSTVIVEFFRAVPLVLLILFVFLGFADTLQSFSNDLGITTLMDNAGLGRSQGALASLVIGLMLYNGSVLAEIFRAGVQSVPKGQREAAYSVGLTSGQTLRMILAPQAIRTMLPAIVSQSVVALKDTSLGLIVAYPELVRQGQLIAAGYNNYVPMAIIIGTVYILINYSLSKLANHLSKRQRRTKKLAPIKADPTLPPDTMIELETNRQLKD